MLITVHRQEGSFIPIYLQGLTMGLAYVAPIGAQNLFMIQTAMETTGNGPFSRR